MLMNKKTIWVNEQNQADTYAEFVGEFQTISNKKVIMNIACDGHFAVYLNDELVFFWCGCRLSLVQDV